LRGTGGTIVTAGITENLAHMWWIVLLEGLAVLLLGLSFVVAPGITVATLLVFLGVWWVASGFFSIIWILIRESDLPWAWSLARGLLGMLMGILVLGYPLFRDFASRGTLVTVVAVGAILVGGMSLIEASKGGGLGSMILGAINIVFGVLLLASPLVGPRVLPILMGILALVGGAVLISLSFRIRKSGDEAPVA
jgi:uncharacterized membrane protein HdeD (DUF308 family)